MTEMYRTMSGISLASSAQNESTSWPSAAPNGLASVARAVALVRPRSENHRSLYRVGALRQNGCAKPMRIWPNMATPKTPPRARVPAYRIQLPTSKKADVVMMAGFGPPLLRVKIATLGVSGPRVQSGDPWDCIDQGERLTDWRH